MNKINPNSTSIADRLQKVRKAIRQAEDKYQRPTGSVELVAVSKTRSVEEINEAIAASQLAFGENYVQEALPKIDAIKNADVIWHYIGQMQTNKAKYLARHFHWVQSVTKIEHAVSLDKYRSASLPPLNICIEINLSNEENKSGITVEAMETEAYIKIVELVHAIIALPRLKLRGLMAIPKSTPDFALQLATFQKLTTLHQKIKQQLDTSNQMRPNLQFDTLSIGMSDDFEAAIAAGATMVRIGTAIFGPRH